MSRTDSSLASQMSEAFAARPAAARPAGRRRIGLVLRLAVSAALIAFVCRRIDTAGLARQFSAQAPVWLVAAAFVTLAQIAIAALRWRQVLLGLGLVVPAGEVIALSYIASFFNSWLLGTMGGDVARAVLAPAGERGRATVVHSVLLDRVVTFAGLGFVILPFAARGAGPLAHSLPVTAALATAFLPIALMPAIAPAAALFGRRLPAADLVFGLAAGWRRLCESWRHFLAGLGFAVASGVALCLTGWCLAQAQALGVSFPDMLMLMPPVMLLSGLPISVGGWGVRENAMIAALSMVGVGAGAATLLSVQLGALAALLSLPAGALWLWRYSLAPRGAGVAIAPVLEP
jgi:glycosyltransferase 2 family protein